MKHLYKQCSSTRQVNQYLKSIKLEEFAFDPEYDFPVEFEHDGWLDSEKTKGVSINVTPSYEVFVVKYSAEDLVKLERELDL